EGDAPEARLAAQRGSAVEVRRGPLVAGAAGRAVDDEQGLLRVGQGYDQGVVAPDAVIRQVHALLALPRRPHQGAVRLDDGVLQEAVGLLLPVLDALLVEDVHQGLDVGRVAAAREVARGRRSWPACGGRARPW